MATCWYCGKVIIGFRYKIAENDCDIACANDQINRSLEILGRLLAENDGFVGFGLGYDKPEFFFYIFVEDEASMHLIRAQCSESEVGFSLYPLMTPLVDPEEPESNVALPDRIVLGGVSIGHALAKNTGTLGGIVRAGDQKFAVSAGDVVAPDGSKLGDPIVQPSVADSPHKMYSLGKLAVISRLGFGSINDLDAAIVSVNEEVPTTPRVMGIGRPNDVAEPELGMNVRKSGRSTGFTEGKVLISDVRMKVLKEGKQFTMQDQFIIMSDVGEFAKRGDEGAFIFNNNNDLVGMIQLAFHGMAMCSRGSILLDRFGFVSPYCFEPSEDDF